MTSQDHPASGPAQELPAAAPAAIGEERSYDGLLRLLAIALLGRALLSFADAIAIATGGLGFMQLGGIAHADGTPVWPLIWGSAALAAALLLLARRPLGWPLGAAVCVAYLVVGVAHAVAATSSASGLPPAVWLVVAADILVPSLVLAGLFTVRPWFLAAARSRRQPAPGS